MWENESNHWGIVDTNSLYLENNSGLHLKLLLRVSLAMPENIKQSRNFARKGDTE